jgi:DNA polymerase-1
VAKILLLDGNSLTYRAFFALPTDMTTASGQVTNAVFGFTSMLVNLFKDHKPDAIVVAFDRPEPTFRHEIVTHYKAQREEAPDILRQQMGLVRQVLEVLAIPSVELPGYEADDLIATMATKAAEKGSDVVIVTGDRDAYQLVHDPHIKVLYNRRGVSDYVLYDEAGIAEKTGVSPEQYAEYAALRGDPSDNLAGVPGVGEKTAAKLINDFGNIDGIYAHLDSLSPKLRENLAASEEQVRMNAKATPLVRDVPIDIDVTTMRLSTYDREAAQSLFQFLEFRTLTDRLFEATGEFVESAALKELSVHVERLEEGTSATKTLDDFTTAHKEFGIAPAWEDPAKPRKLVGLAFAATKGEKAEAIFIPEKLLASAEVIQSLKRLSADLAISMQVHNAKLLLHHFVPLGISLRSISIDTRIAAYLIDPSDDAYELGVLLSKYVSLELPSEVAAPTGQLDFGEHDAAEQTAAYAGAISALAPLLAKQLETLGMWDLYTEIERPLIDVLARMEILGIQVDIPYLEELRDELTKEVAQLEKEIQDLAGEPFKINSTLQLRSVLFEKLNLAPQKKTKTGYSTDAASLEKLLGTHPIIEKLLRYREVEKLRSTYGDSLLNEIAKDGRIHATFNQTVARTGRLSSDKPNLHNIPVRSEEGRRFRRAFVPARGSMFLIADYNQIELRVIAHLSEDPGLIEAFRTESDIHRATAARVFGCKPEDVTFEQRNRAKMVGYGLAYGMESYGLAQRLGIGVEEASEILNAFFDGFPKIRDYMNTTVEEARKRGYTETLFGRRRPIPELNSGNFRVRQAGERQAMNAGIQGLAADIFKVALIKIDNVLVEHELESRLVLQVHDEVLLEVPESEQERATELTLDAMRNAAELSVPLEVNASWVSTWADK